MRTLQQQILSATKTLNSRLRRLRAEDLPTSAEQHMQNIDLHRPGFLTPKGFVSASTAGMSQQDLQEKLKLIKTLISETETVKEARANVEQKMKEWNVKKEEAKRLIRAGRVFYQALGYRGGVFDSDRVHVSIEEFDKTPNYPELINRLFMDYGREMQNERNGRISLMEWMRETNQIPPGVMADRNPQTGLIQYFDFDRQGNKHFLVD